MKLHFEPNLDFQLQVVEAVCDLFRGQEVCRTESTVTQDTLVSQIQLAYAETGLGVGNRLSLLWRKFRTSRLRTISLTVP